jgi:5-methylcytosine-specific restriction endonuclease McrA
MEIIRNIRDKLQGKIPSGKKRSPKWPAVRKKHLERIPYCVICNGTKTLEVHHIKPFHLNPELELDPNNLMTLCESGKNGVTCHRFFGHLGNYKKINPFVRADAFDWSLRLRNILPTDNMDFKND